MSFDPITAPIDYIRLAGQKSPGVAEIVNAADLREWAVRLVPFSEGAIMFYKRRALAEFSVRIRLATLQDHADFAAWRAVVDAKPKIRTRATALDIWHPILEDIDIKAAVVKKVSQPTQVDDGIWEYTIDFLEWRGAPVQTLKKVDGSQATPVDPVDREIADLADQVAKEAAK